MNSKEKAELFEKVYSNLTWDNYSELVDKLSHINKNELDKELTEMGSLYAYFNGLLARSRKELELAELKLEKTIAETRNNMDNSSNKKLTEKAIESRINQREEYIQASEVLIIANEKYNLLKGLLDSLKIRCDCLIQLSSNARAEAKLL